jgi:uncharacterized membrane protein YqjE
MSFDELFRIVLAAACMIVALGCLGEMVYGPARSMTWAQFLRYTGLLILVATILWAQYEKRHAPVTGYTVAFAVGAIVGSLGVSPRLKTPMLKPTRSSRDIDTRG